MPFVTSYRNSVAMRHVLGDRDKLYHPLSAQGLYDSSDQAISVYDAGVLAMDDNNSTITTSPFGNSMDAHGGIAMKDIIDRNIIDTPSNVEWKPRKLQPLRVIVALSVKIMNTEGGYISPTKNSTANTHTKVLELLNDKTKIEALDEEYWMLADEIIEFFSILPTLPEYKSVLEREDGPAFHACSDAAKVDVVDTLTFPFVVIMPHLYAKLKPKTQKSLNPLTSEAKLFSPGEFLGTINVPGRFFVKLVYVTKPDITKGGSMFVVEDRNGNRGFWYDNPEKFENDIQLNDCFSIHATPSRHTSTKDSEKHTTFRNVKIVERKGKSLTLVDAKNDETGKFVKDQEF